MNRRLPALHLLILAATLWACGDGSTGGPVAGAAGEAAAERGPSSDWALMSIPTGGGSATLHPLSDPGRELWSGAVSLPAAERAVRVAPRLVAIRGPGGTVYRYDPAEGAVSELGDLAGDVLWQGGEDGGVWIRRDGAGGGGLLWTLSTEGAVRRTVDRSVQWAALGADGATVALLGPGPSTLVRWPVAADEPDASLELAAGPPAAMTAWGRIAVLTRSDESGVLQIVSLAEMETRERIDVDGPVTAVAVSPSSHEIYVAVDDPPRLVVVDRFGGEVRSRISVQRPVSEIRPGVAGGPPLIWDGQAAYLLPWGGGEPVRLETSWRPDLPLSLPDGSALVARDGAVERTLHDGGAHSSGSADRIWVPVRWRAEAETSAPTEDTASRAAISTAGDDTASAGEDAAETGPGAAVGPDSAGADSTALDPGLEVTDPGFYVILGWSRSPAGIREQLRTIREAGFPVAVQTRRDDAGTEWYRGLVGPYSRRERAEQVSRTLQREQAVEGWVQEVRPGLLSNEAFR